jgi:choline dehydrogenase
VEDRTFEWTTGRLSGGGSSINGEQYVRPTAAVFEEWQQLLGPVWSPRRTLNRFIRLENYQGVTDNSQAHGSKGPIHIRQAPVHPTAMAQKLVSAIEQATGLQEIADYNDPNTPLGPFTRWQLFQKPSGQRVSSW